MVLSTQELPCMYEVWPSPFQPTSTPEDSRRDSATAHWYGVAGSCRSPTTKIGRVPAALTRSAARADGTAAAAGPAAAGAVAAVGQ